MIFFERQTKGVIAISIVLAIIPFIIFISESKVNYRISELSNQFPEKVIVEIAENGKSRGIYFIAPKTSANQLLKSIGIEYPVEEDLILDSGMKITINSNSNNPNVTVAKIESSKRLALSMPLDINRATETDLILVSGIGEVTAKKILGLRSKLGRYKNIEQLTEIKGIKENKLAKLRKYLYVEK
jgi:competence protein ComEA